MKKWKILSILSFLFILNSIPLTLVNAAPVAIDIPISTTAINTQSEHTMPPPSMVLPPPNFNSSAYVLMDADSGAIIASDNMHKRLQPASLTKLMTLYITFQAIKSGQIRLDDKAHISEKAWSTGGSRMFIKAGSYVPIEKLIQGVIVASGNDACVALAQFIAGNEIRFAEIMNQTAKRLGMKNSHYVDSTGLPRPNHYSTAYDMAILTQALIRDFPEYYPYFNEKWIKYNNIKQPNRNRLLWRDNSVDGLKTGHTKSAGYCLVSSAKRSNMRLISVLMGAASDNRRAMDSEALLNYGFRFYQTFQLFESKQAITKPRVWYGQHKNGTFGLAQPLVVTIPVGQYDQLSASLIFNKKLIAPIHKNREYGTVEVTLKNKVIASAPLIALADDPKGGLLTRLTDRISMFLKSLFGKA